MRHPERTRPITPPSGEMHLDEITAHVERHFGKVANVFHEIVSDLVHLDVLIVEPTEARPWYVLVTSGMSDLPMKVPAGHDAPRHAELVIAVASRVTLDDKALKDERYYWPIRHLKTLARMPHALDTWLAPGQTVASDPPQPVAPGVPFCAFGVLELLDPAARRLRTQDGTEISFLQLVPMFGEELVWKLQHREPGALAEMFDDEALRVALPERPNLHAQESTVEIMVGRIYRGRRLARAVAVLLVVLALGDVAATWADGARIAWTRLGLTALLAYYLADGARWARWAAVGVLGLGVAFGGWLLVQRGFGTWRQLGLALALPCWLAAIVVLVRARSVGTFFAAQAKARVWAGDS